MPAIIPIPRKSAMYGAKKSAPYVPIAIPQLITDILNIAACHQVSLNVLSIFMPAVYHPKSTHVYSEGIGLIEKMNQIAVNLALIEIIERAVSLMQLFSEFYADISPVPRLKFEMRITPRV